MAPKKHQQKQNAKPKPQSSSSGSKGPKLQISAENESRLRRLLLSSDRPAQAATPVQDSTLRRAQKAKRLNTVYEKLSCEGFSNDQIELALSALKDGTTFEAALDWLCLNVPGNELPLKFSSGTSLHGNGGGSVCVVSTTREDWTPSVEPSDDSNDYKPTIAVRIKGRREDDNLDSRSQADWIRQYMEQQEEVEPESWEDNLDGQSSKEKVTGPRSYDVIAEEYYAARLEAMRA